jgi:hypothetical protein
MNESKEESKGNNHRNTANHFTNKLPGSWQRTSITYNKIQFSDYSALRIVTSENHKIEFFSSRKESGSHVAKVSQLAWNNAYQTTYEKELFYIRTIYNHRINDETATTWVHNYGFDFTADTIMKNDNIEPVKRNHHQKL